MFAKVFAQIFDSSIAEDYRVRLVFEDFLKLSDKHGVVDMTPESIARRTNVPIEIVKHGISELEKPDKISRSPDLDGRRIVRLDDHREWGWRIVNHAKYRESADREMLRMADADRKAEWRRRKGFSPDPNPKRTDTEVEAEAERVQVCPNLSGTSPGQYARFQKPTQAEMELYAAKLALPPSEVCKFFDHYESNGWKVSKAPMRSWQAAMRNWNRNYRSGAFSVNKPRNRGPNI